MARMQRNTPMVPRLGAFLAMCLLISALVAGALFLIVSAVLALWSTSLALMAETISWPG